jgi:hypothetical protein
MIKTTKKQPNTKKESKTKKEPKIVKGLLHKHLGIPEGVKITHNHDLVNILNEISAAEVGDVITNKSGIGKLKIPVTEKLKKEVNFTINTAIAKQKKDNYSRGFF